MLCQRCSQNQAAIHVEKNINGKKTEIHLCQTCYKDIGGTASGEFGWTSLFGGIESATGFYGQPIAKKSPKCSNCGLTYEKFISGGKFGCPNCYGEFSEKLEHMFKKLHGNTTHQGRLPEDRKSLKKPRIKKTQSNHDGETTKTSEVEKSAESVFDLKQQLAKAVKVEDYALAAKLRDRLLDLEKQDGESDDK